MTNTKLRTVGTMCFLFSCSGGGVPDAKWKLGPENLCAGDRITGEWESEKKVDASLSHRDGFRMVNMSGVQVPIPKYSIINGYNWYDSKGADFDFDPQDWTELKGAARYKGKSWAEYVDLDWIDVAGWTREYSSPVEGEHWSECECGPDPKCQKQSCPDPSPRCQKQSCQNTCQQSEGFNARGVTFKFPASAFSPRAYATKVSIGHDSLTLQIEENAIVKENGTLPTEPHPGTVTFFAKVIGISSVGCSLPGSTCSNSQVTVNKGSKNECIKNAWARLWVGCKDAGEEIIIEGGTH